MNRRGFLKFAAGGAVGLVASPFIWNTLYDAVYWTQNWGWIPRLKNGAEDLIPTVSKLCPSGTGITVRLVEGRPVRALSAPDNAMSQGGLTALAVAEPQLRVSDARLKTPLRRSPDGMLVAINWEEAEALLKSKIEEAGGSITCISGDPTTSINDLLSGLLGAKGSGEYFFMPGEELAASVAWDAMGGRGRMGYDLENSDHILAIGANFLESWGTVARNRALFKKSRPAGGEPAVEITYVGPVQNNTAAGADQWLPARSGSEMVVAMGIIHLLIKSGSAAALVGLEHLAALAESYSPERVKELAGIDANQLTAEVGALLAAKKPLVIVGSESGAGGGAGPIMAGIAINMLLGRVGQEGNLRALPFPPKVVPQALEYRDIVSRDLVGYARKVKNGERPAPGLLLMYEANPVYALPPDSGIAELMAQSGFKVLMTGFLNETCQECDLVLPAAHGMERFDDVYTPYGSGEVNYALAHPVVDLYAKSRPMGEVLLSLARAMGIDLGVSDMPQLLHKKAGVIGANFRHMMDTGSVYVGNGARAFSLPYLNVSALSAALETQRPSGDITVAPVTVLGIGTPQTAIPPFATKLLTEYQLKGKYSVAQMNGATASKLGVKKGDRLRLNNGETEVYALADIFEGVVPDTVAMCTGLGHTAFDEFSQNKGANIVTLTRVTEEPGTGLSVWGNAAVSVTRA